MKRYATFLLRNLLTATCTCHHTTKHHFETKLSTIYQNSGDVIRTNVAKRLRTVLGVVHRVHRLFIDERLHGQPFTRSPWFKVTDIFVQREGGSGGINALGLTCRVKNEIESSNRRSEKK